MCCQAPSSCVARHCQGWPSFASCETAVTASAQARDQRERLCSISRASISARLGLLVGQVEVGQLDPGAAIDCFSPTVPVALKSRRRYRWLGELDLDAQRIARGDELAVLHVPGLLQDRHGAGEIGAVVQQPAGRLGDGLQHHHARQDRERGEMVGEVLLGQADVLHARRSASSESSSILSIRLNFTPFFLASAAKQCKRHPMPRLPNLNHQSTINGPMCGRFALLDLADFLAMFPWVVPPEQFAPRYNISPSQPILMLSNRGGGTLDHAIWGLIPNWAKSGPDAPKPLVNARCETVSQKPAFRTSLRYRRCIVPASGFYEWQQGRGGKQPYYITLAERRPMLMAGLWEDSYDGSGGEIRTACVITTAANPFMRELHDRMPAILAPEQATQWIKAPDTEAESLCEILRPYGRDLAKVPVSRLVNTPANDTKECIEAMSASEDQGLFGSL